MRVSQKTPQSSSGGWDFDVSGFDTSSFEDIKFDVPEF